MELRYKVTTPPADEPITLAEAKAQCRVESSFTEDDDLLNSYIAVARVFAEDWTERAFITQTITAKSDAWPCGRVLELPRAPLVSVTSVQYYDADNALQTLDSSLYLVDTYSEPGRIELKRDKSWPALYDRGDAIQFVLTAGYGAAADVPVDIKQAIKLMVALCYDVRQPVSASAMPRPALYSMESLLYGRKVFSQWTRAS